MLKHVSYRASSTSLGRNYSSCRGNPVSQKDGGNDSAVDVCLISANNSIISRHSNDNSLNHSSNNNNSLNHSSNDNNSLNHSANNNNNVNHFNSLAHSSDVACDSVANESASKKLSKQSSLDANHRYQPLMAQESFDTVDSPISHFQSSNSEILSRINCNSSTLPRRFSEESVHTKYLNDQDCVSLGSTTTLRHNSLPNNSLPNNALPNISLPNDRENDSHHFIKSDDPLSKHRKDMRSEDTFGNELMPSSGYMPSLCEQGDNISLNSAFSMNSLVRNDSTDSAISVTSNKVPVRIHMSKLRPDVEYKTLRLDAEVTCNQLIEHLIYKMRVKHRDPNLYCVVFSAAVRGPGGAPPVTKRFVLEGSARPVELQQCRPRGEANFSISERRGGILKVEDSILTPGSRYKSVLVSYTSTVVDVIKLLLRCNNRSDDWRMFTLHEKQEGPFRDRVLSDHDKPLDIQNSWPKEERSRYALVLRRHMTKGLLEPWHSMSIDEECCAEADLDEHNSTCCSILTTSSDSSRSRASISSSTASVLSLNSVSSGSSRCSFSSNSSSGVSSGSSSSSGCHTETPKKEVNFKNRPLPPLPVSPDPITKKFSISAEENVRSYFAILPEDECLSPLLPVEDKQEVSVHENCDELKRPPQPLPRRFLNFNQLCNKSEEYANSSIIADLKNAFSSPEKTTKLRSLSLSPMSWIKSNASISQKWQNESRLSRIRSTILCKPLKNKACRALLSRSKSTEIEQLDTLKSHPSTPVLSSINSKRSFTFSPPPLHRALSTSSLNTSPNSNYKTVYDHAVVPPFSSKLRPLSLAPNSSITFPSSSNSLQSLQSTSTLTLTSSSITLITPDVASNATTSDSYKMIAADKANSLPTKHSSSAQLPKNRSNEILKTSFAAITLENNAVKTTTDFPKQNNTQNVKLNEESNDAEGLRIEQSKLLNAEKNQVNDSAIRKSVDLDCSIVPTLTEARSIPCEFEDCFYV